MISGGQIIWYAVAICENDQDLLADGKSQNERRFGESFKGPIIPFGALVGYLPNSERDKARIHQLGKQVVPRIFPGCALIAGRIWEEDILIAENEELGRLDACENFPGRLNAKEVLITQKRWRICFSCGRWFSKIIRKRLRIPRTHSETGIHREERVSAENLMAMGKSFNLKNQKMTLKLGKTFGLFKKISLIVIMLNREFNHTCPEKNHSLFHWSILMSSGQFIPIWT